MHDTDHIYYCESAPEIFEAGGNVHVVDRSGGRILIHRVLSRASFTASIEAGIRLLSTPQAGVTAIGKGRGARGKP